MKRWTPAQLQRFAVADDLRISPFYSDGRTYGTPTWIWSVVVDQHLYVRAWHGQRSSWYQSAVQQRAGRIYLAGQNYPVNFAPVTDQTALVDAAYRQKYGQSAYLLPMIQAGPQAATIEILPR
ncbi:MAG: DUF2255 family protein [Levilactobacillus sp.]|jgi:hypothetical protein|uniref:DUF2255 family protein n=1 Tax=Levilactobacillus sp. TaxID=2767919 RepID=UPI00258517D0|nr:DUF2255 family protein [Levilactobacillus sp.]MCI1553462.1 DUF2255 family protein [Levilactobacillus sp.]MCI1597851.1 DUF2255 family protein [Levilactobacillus sp.]MCI1605649.1 DUF2255 family protein [Levilactobacillus sp.]